MNRVKQRNMHNFPIFNFLFPLLRNSAKRIDGVENEKNINISTAVEPRILISDFHYAINIFTILKYSFDV